MRKALRQKEIIWFANPCNWFWQIQTFGHINGGGERKVAQTCCRWHL